MFLLMRLNVLAVVSHHVAKAPAAQDGGIDAVMMFGFAASFCTIVAASYHHKLQTHFPLLGICLIGLSIYGFLQGTWMLGFSIAALSISEFARWHSKKLKRFQFLQKSRSESKTNLNPDSRVARMFGSM